MRDLNIAYGNSCMAKRWSNKTTSWEALGERLKTTIRTTESVEEYQKIVEDVIAGKLVIDDDYANLKMEYPNMKITMVE